MEGTFSTSIISFQTPSRLVQVRLGGSSLHFKRRKSIRPKVEFARHGKWPGW